MATKISPQDLQLAAKAGFDRIKTYRKARAMFIKAYVGKYYAQKYGLTGDQPLNLLFNAIRVMVPNLVMYNPKIDVGCKPLVHRDYAELLGLGIDEVFEQTGFVWRLRAEIVDALFGFGIMKSAIKDSGQFMVVDDMQIDPGQVYNQRVDLDNFTFDPTCTNFLFHDATFTGDAVVVPRAVLLDTNGYNHDLVNKMPSVYSETGDKGQASDISKPTSFGDEFASKRDLVRIVHLWVPTAGALITIPDPRDHIAESYLKKTEYYGPIEGPYSYLSFTPPVPDNPFPVAPVSIWYDLHEAANRVAAKLLDQVDRQKDVTLYDPAQADEAEAIRDAEDGDYIASTNPAGVNVISYGGQNSKNEAILAQIQTWFSYMAGNIEQLGGAKAGADTATGQEILQANATVTIEDSKGITKEHVRQIARKTGWYLFTDPLIDVPLTKRKNGESIDVHLTWEQRQGDFLNYTFKVHPHTLVRLDPTIRSRRIIEFTVNVIPALANATQICAGLGIPFNFQKTVSMVGKEMGMEEEMADMFNDPDLMKKLELTLMKGPQPQEKPGYTSNAGTQQNNGFTGARPVPTAKQEINETRQLPAAESQAARIGAM